MLLLATVNTCLFTERWLVMKGLQTVFENEEAVRLLNYFISYKEMINKTETKNEIEVEIGAIPKTEEIVIK